MNNYKYFRESASYEEHEKEEAKIYLISWKKFLIRRLCKDSYDVKIIDEQWIERPSFLDGATCQRNKMILHLCIEAKWHYELEGELK